VLDHDTNAGAAAALTARLSAKQTQHASTREFLADVLPELQASESYIYGTLPGGYCDSGQQCTMPAQHATGIDDLASRSLRLDGQGLNLYFCHATFPDDKPRQTEFARRIKALRIDFDVFGRNGKNADKKYARKADALNDVARVEQELLAASWVIDSGHGYHVYWVLDEALPASDWSALATAFRAWLDARAFKADPAITTNIVGVLRVPGTHNRKHANEQLPVIVVRQGEHVAVETMRDILTDFPPINGRPNGAGVSKSLVDLSLAPAPSWFDPLDPEPKKQIIRSLCAALPLEQLNTYDYWLATVADIRAAVGLSENEKLALAIDASRRTATFDEAELRNKWGGLTRGNIGALITRAKAAGWKRSPESYPGKFVTVENFHSYLREEQWALVCGGRGDREYIDPNNQPVSIESFGDLHDTRMLDGKGAHKVATREGGVRKVSAAVYRPGRERFFNEAGVDYVNTWRECCAEPIKPTQEQRTRFWGPIAHLIAGDGETKTGLFWYVHLLAWKQRHRDQRVPLFPVLVGEIEGSGKSTLFYDLPVAALGAENVGRINNAEVGSAFTDWVGEKEWVVLDEMKISNRGEAAQIANSLKTIVTEKMVRQVRKGKAGRTISNISTYVGTSNHLDAAHLSDSDRRYFVIHTRAQRMPAEISKPWHDLLESACGPGIVRYELEKLDISNFDPYAPPMDSEARRRMMAASRTEVEDAVFTAYENQEGCFRSDIITTKCATALVREKVGRNNVSERVVRNALEKYCDAKSERITQRVGSKLDRHYVYIIRNHDRWLEATGAEQMEEYRRGPIGGVTS